MLQTGVHDEALALVDLDGFFQCHADTADDYAALMSAVTLSKDRARSA